ncbi:Ribosome maturation factor RimM [Buchnera aphidicola (Eriosoma lanigerum)]|uniref:ribosome maturation factor RimM n=1 Tax=Buchnera aphidicola TaxID=9 RepID=UPI0034645E5A
MYKKSNFIIVGKFIAPYGLLGWIKIISFTENINNIVYYTPWYITINNKLEIIKLLLWNKKKNLLVKCETINDRNTAEKFSNKNIMIHKSQLPILPIYEYYWKDLINCNIINFNTYLGTVKNVINTGANDILIVKNNNKKIHTDILIPFIMNQVIKNVNLIHKVIKIEWDINH